MISDERIRLMKLPIEARVFQCPHNPVCACEKRQCARCGWNPEVAKSRSEAILGRMEERHG